MNEQQINERIQQIINKFNMIEEPVFSRNKIIERICLKISSQYYKYVEQSWFKIKYFLQRLFRGYDDLDKWNAAWYIARKAIPVLKAMRNNFTGTSIKWHREDRFGNIVELTREEVFVDDGAPAAFTEDEWRDILDQIIYAFEFVLNQDMPVENFNAEEYEQNYKKHKRGLKLFFIYYLNLWD